MSLATWTVVMLIVTGVCAFTIKNPMNPFRGFLYWPGIMWVHIILGLITLGLAIAVVAS